MRANVIPMLLVMNIYIYLYQGRYRFYQIYISKVYWCLVLEVLLLTSLSSAAKNYVITEGQGSLTVQINDVTVSVVQYSLLIIYIFLNIIVLYFFKMIFIKPR